MEIFSQEDVGCFVEGGDFIWCIVFHISYSIAQIIVENKRPAIIHLYQLRNNVLNILSKECYIAFDVGKPVNQRGACHREPSCQPLLVMSLNHDDLKFSQVTH